MNKYCIVLPPLHSPSSVLDFSGIFNDNLTRILHQQAGSKHTKRIQLLILGVSDSSPNMQVKCFKVLSIYLVISLVEGITANVTIITISFALSYLTQPKLTCTTSSLSTSSQCGNRTCMNQWSKESWLSAVYRLVWQSEADKCNVVTLPRSFRGHNTSTNKQKKNFPQPVPVLLLHSSTPGTCTQAHTLPLLPLI